MSNDFEMPEALAAYRFAIRETVVWGDLDAMNHVNNTQYFRYMESARIRFIEEVFPGLAGPSADSNLELGLALAETRCRFKVSLTYPDEIIISAGVREFNDDQFLVQHEIYSTKLACVVAEGDARLVSFDFQKKCKSKISADSNAALQKYALDKS